jgi:hypothetical protein
MLSDGCMGYVGSDARDDQASRCSSTHLLPYRMLGRHGPPMFYARCRAISSSSAHLTSQLWQSAQSGRNNCTAHCPQRTVVEQAKWHDRISAFRETCSTRRPTMTEICAMEERLS